MDRANNNNDGETPISLVSTNYYLEILKLFILKVAKINFRKTLF